MASGKTENYGLSQWEATDQVVRLDFNLDNEKIDAGMAENKAAAAAAQEAVDNLAAVAYTAENAPFVVGSYTGNASTTQTINLGFKPKAVSVFRTELVSTQWDTGAYFGMATANKSLASGSNIVLKVTDSGFIVGTYNDGTSYAPKLNVSSSTYVYIALK